MAHIGFFVISTVFLLLIGITPSTSVECNQANNRRCQRNTRNSELGSCEQSKSDQACFENIDKNCTDPELARIIRETIWLKKLSASKCPGMQSGECFRTARSNCTGMIPFMVEIAMAGNNVEENCPTYLSYSPRAKNCFNDLKTKCPSESAVHVVNAELAAITRNENTCAEF